MPATVIPLRTRGQNVGPRNKVISDVAISAGCYSSRMLMANSTLRTSPLFRPVRNFRLERPFDDRLNQRHR